MLLLIPPLIIGSSTFPCFFFLYLLSKPNTKKEEHRRTKALSYIIMVSFLLFFFCFVFFCFFFFLFAGLAVAFCCLGFGLFWLYRLVGLFRQLSLAPGLFRLSFWSFINCLIIRNNPTEEKAQEKHRVKEIPPMMQNET